MKLDTASEDPWLMGVLIEAADDGRARHIEQLLVPLSERSERLKRRFRGTSVPAWKP